MQGQNGIDSKARDLRGLFHPRSIAIVGASERNVFSALAATCLRAVDYRGKVFAVNREGKMAHGFPGHASCRAIGEPVDAAYIGVPSASVLPAIEEAAAAGIRNFVVVSGGFAETGPAGAEAQARLQDLCRREGLNLLGPNCLGHFNIGAGTAVGALTVDALPRPGPVAFVSASGALVSQMLRYCRRQNIGVSHGIATGNEAVLSAADIITHLVGDPDVRAIALFFEGVRDPDRFVAACRAARRARKPIVILKVGRSPLAKTVARAHTGTDTGDDAAFDALCAEHGLIRVDSLEELAVTAALIAETGPLQDKGLAFISMSGGACEIMADQAHAHGLPVPDYSPATRAALVDLVAAGGLGSVYNPLDLTGAVARDTGLWEKVIDAMAADAGIGTIVAQCDQPTQWERTPTIERVFENLAVALAKHRRAPRALFMSTMTAPLGPYDREFQAAAGSGLILPNIATGVAALAKAMWWSRHVEHSEG